MKQITLNRYQIICAVLFMSIIACKSKVTNTSTALTDSVQTQVTVSSCNAKEYVVAAVLYQQQSGEYRALAYQAFSLAKMRINEALRKKSKHDTLAIITDLDETMLDNSGYDAHIINKNTIDPTGSIWTEWVGMKKADSLPGSVSFLKYADAKHIKIYYITNRAGSDLGNTMEDMHNLGFPQLDSTHFYMDMGDGNKQGRFDSVTNHYKVVLQLGDNLNDFSGAFYQKTDVQRKNIVDSMANKFGNNYIALPNATYGAWEDALYGYGKDSTASMQSDRRHKTLLGY